MEKKPWQSIKINISCNGETFFKIAEKRKTIEETESKPSNPKLVKTNWTNKNFFGKMENW